MSRMGKTTFLLRYLVADSRIVCRFIFDPLGLMAGTLGLVTAETLEELECAVADGWVCFEPSALFPGQPGAALEWFTRWSYDRAKALPGRKALLVDEVWKYQSAQRIPQALAEWVQDGAKWGMECLFATQVPNKLNSAIVGQLTELVCFKLQEKNALAVVEGLGLEKERVQCLAPGQFVALNLFSGGRREGRVF
jgi:hypothetical protein